MFNYYSFIFTSLFISIFISIFIFTFIFIFNEDVEYCQIFSWVYVC
mgnify:CR=1 FL=1